MRRTLKKEGLALLECGRQTDGIVTEEQLSGLPEPIKRYLTYAQIIGKERIRTVRLKQHGSMSLKEGAKWLPLTAEQYFTTNPPAFLWNGMVHPFPLVSISATDTFSEGHGKMRIKAFSFIPMGTATGPEMDQGELLRYLGEIAWFPTALLSELIHWQAVDSERATATISLSGITASAVFHVDEQGSYTHLTAERYREEHKQQVLRPWTGRWSDYRDIEGFRIPTKAAASYTLESGEYDYFRCRITAIQYNHSLSK